MGKKTGKKKLLNVLKVSIRKAIKITIIKFNAIEHRYGIETRRSFEYTLDWLHEHACSRSYGLGMH